MPELLVSVKNATEARMALQAGCAVLDIKNPDRGALGRPEITEVSRILHETSHLGWPGPVSLAWGELREAHHPDTLPVTWQRLNYLKAGSAGIESLSDWLTAYDSLQRAWRSAGQTSAQGIAVLYADFPSAQSLPLNSPRLLRELVAALQDRDCAGLLIDTYDKQGPSLPALLKLHPDVAEGVMFLEEQLRASGRLIALAGRLTFADPLRMLQSGWQPDLFGVRSAVCMAEDRWGTLCGNRVSGLVESLRSAGAPPLMTTRPEP
jgi:(5-formylfuran-3-yl)methyl phosphate synthase